MAKRVTPEEAVPPTRKRKKRQDARTPPQRKKARSQARPGARKGGSGASPRVDPNVRLLFVEHLMRGFRETDLPQATRRALGMGPRATREAMEAVRHKWLEQSRLAPAEALRVRELASLDEVLRMLLFDGAKIRDSALLDMPSVVKILQLRDRVTERLLKNEDALRAKTTGFLGCTTDLSGADSLAGRDDMEMEKPEAEVDE